MTNEDLVFNYQRTGDNSYLAALYQNNIAFIEKIAYQYDSMDMFDDLCQEGYFGIEQAAKRYNPDKGASFLTYAYEWIRAFMSRYVRYNRGFARIPNFMYERIRNYKRTIDSYRKKYGKDPDSEYLIQKLHITDDQMDEIRNAIALLSSDMSLEQPITEDGLTVADVLQGDTNQIDDLMDDIERDELKTVLWGIVDKLHGKEPDVLHLRYEQGKTLNECGKELGISGERVRQYEVSGMRRIRKTKRRELQPYIEDIIFSQGLKGTGLKSFKNSGFESAVERAVIRIEERNH